MRENNGLRADPAWVEQVEVDSLSLVRLGIRVTAGEAKTLDDRAVRWAAEQRRRLGLRADEPYVREVNAAATSETRLGGLRVTPSEAALIDRRTVEATEQAGVLAEYGAQHADEWGGLYFDDAGALHIVVTDHAADHRAAAEALLFDQVPVTVHLARWSQQELQAFREELAVDADLRQWLLDRGLRVTGLGIVVPENRVRLEVAASAGEEEVASRVLRHLDRPAWLLVAVVPAAPPFEGGTGRLVVTVVDHAGRPVEDAVVVIKADVESAPIGNGQTPFCDLEPEEGGVCRWSEVGATGYVIQVWRAYQQGFLGMGYAVVPDGGEAQVTVVAAGP